MINGFKNGFSNGISIKQKMFDGINGMRNTMSSGVTEQDIVNIKAYNDQIDACVTSQTAFYRTMQTSSKSAQDLVIAANGNTVSLKDLTVATNTSKASMVGARVAATALNMALSMGLAVGIQLIISGLDKMVHAAKDASEAADELKKTSMEKAQAEIEEAQKLDELIAKYKELAEGDTQDVGTREEIKSVQSDIVDLVGQQADNLDLVNGKLDEQISKLKVISQAEAKKAVESSISAYHAAKDSHDKAIGQDSALFADDYAYVSDEWWSNEDDVIELLQKNGYSNSVQKGGIFGSHTFIKDSIDKDFSVLEGATERAEYLNGMIDIIKEKYSDYASSDIYNALVTQRDTYLQYVEDMKNAAFDLVESEIVLSQAYNKELTDINVNSLDSYEKYRDKLIELVEDSPSLSEAIQSGDLNKNDITKKVDEYLGTLDSFSDYYNKWQNKYNNSTINNAKDMKNKFAQIIGSNSANFKKLISTFDVPDLTDEAKQKIEEFNNWFDGLNQEDKECVYKISTQLNFSAETIDEWQKELTNYKFSAITIDVDVATESIDNLMSSFNTVKGVIKDYNENGHISYDNMQSLLKLDDKYIDMLINEQGELDLTADRFKDLAKAQLKQLEVAYLQEAIDTVTNITTKAQALEYLTGVQDENTESILDLADAKWDEVFATMAARDAEQGTGTLYQDVTKQAQSSWFKRQQVMKSYGESLSDLTDKTDDHTEAVDKEKEALESEQDALEASKKALEDKKETLEKQKDGYDDAINSIKDLIDWTENYIKQIKEDEKEALEEEKKKTDELIDKKIELLDIEKERADFNKQLADKQNTVASNALAAAIAELDDSSAGKKASKEAQDALNESRSELNDFLYEHEIDTRKEALNKMKEDSDEYYDNQINTISEYLSNEVQLYSDACNMIDNDNGMLYQNLLWYCQNYTTTSEAEFNHMWQSAQIAMEQYNIANLSTFDLINQLQSSIYQVDNAIDTIASSIDDYSAKIDNVKSRIDDLSNSAQTATDKIQTTIDKFQIATNEENKWAEKHKAKWYYNWQGTKYESDQSDKNNAISDILRQISSKYGGVIPSSASTIYGTIKHYASGTKSAKGGIAKVGEKGAEYRVLNEGDGIVTANATETLEKFGKNPNQYTKDSIVPVIEDEIAKNTFVTKDGQTLTPLSDEELSDFGRVANLVSGYFDNGNYNLDSSQILQNLGTQTADNVSVNNSPNIVTNFTNQIYGDVNQSTLKALQEAEENIIKKSNQQLMKKMLQIKHIR